MSKHAIIIIGASGDLSHRKLIPALDNLYRAKKIDKNLLIVGCGRHNMDNERFRASFSGCCPQFKQRLFYRQGISGVKNYIAAHGSFSRVAAFLAIPPRAYINAAKQLNGENFGDELALIVEKPFGHDLQSARELNRSLQSCFKERQIFRSDHYLAKEAVQNILVFRFANSLFEPAWNNRFVESIQLTAFETMGIENRAAYYDSAGALRDMAQNHLMQMLCLTTMEAPATLDSEEIRGQKMNVLKALRVIKTHRQQFHGYTEQPGVAADSDTETYIELKLSIDNYRWAGVPIYIRTGKAAARSGTEIGIRFKRLPRILFNKRGNVEQNSIIIRIQPSEGIVVDLASKIPGTKISIANSGMNFCYRDAHNRTIADAYQRLLLDALEGDRTLFVGGEESELSWLKLDKFIGRGVLDYYNPGEEPVSRFSDVWIDSKKFSSVC